VRDWSAASPGFLRVRAENLCLALDAWFYTSSGRGAKNQYVALLPAVVCDAILGALALGDIGMHVLDAGSR